MPDPIILGTITLYAKIVVLKDDKGDPFKNKKGDPLKFFSVARYSTPEIQGKCLIPFKQSAEVKDDLYVRPEDSDDFPKDEGSGANGECGVKNPFLKYFFKEGQVMWLAVNCKNEPVKGVRGRLSEIFRIQIG